MDYDPKVAIASLQSTPGLLDAWLRSLPEEWVRANRGPDTFSSFDVVGHLICGEIDDWMPRLRHIVAHGEDREFVPFDRFAMRERDAGKSMGDLLDEFAATRRASVQELQATAVDATLLARTGRHPEFGVVTARQHLATWVVHDHTHIAQVARTLAWQMRDTVGPWRKYLTVLHG